MPKFIDPNLQFKSSKVDKTLQIVNVKGQDIPLPSEIEISESGMCNRKCSFCPRSNPSYEHINEFISLNLIQKLINEIKELEYTGTIRFSGFVEPLLDKRIFKIIEMIKSSVSSCNIELVTNGDVLNYKRLVRLFKSGLNKILISAYDSKEQALDFENLCHKANLNNDQYIVRHRYLPPDEDFGITLSNRAGEMVDAEYKIDALNESLSQPCFIPGYTFFMDFQGDVLICPHDWGKKSKMGNFNEVSLLDLWLDKKWINIRRSLIKGNRNFKPCNVCDVNGMLIGKKHANAWSKI